MPARSSNKRSSSNNSSSIKKLEEYEKQKAAAKAAGDTVAEKKFDKAIASINERLESSIKNTREFDDSLRSLGATIGKDSKLFEAFNTHADSVKATLGSIAHEYKNIGSNTALKRQVDNAVTSYKKFNETLAVSEKKLIKQQITTSQYNESIIDAYESLEEFIDRIDQSTEAGQNLAKTLTLEKDRLEAYAKAAEKSKNALQGINFVTDKLNTTGIPAMGEFGTVIEKAMEGGKGLTLAMAALGFAAGKAAYDLGLVGDKLGTIAGYDAKIAVVQARIDTFNKKFDLGLTSAGKRNYVAESAAIDFGAQMATMGLQFEAASKTALFGTGLGSLQYGASQLQIAGINAENIATAMKDVSSVMGSNVSAKFGADVAILAARTGLSSENVASISEYFQRASNYSAETSLNMVEGLRTMAKQANINLGTLMEDVAEASKNALSYQIKSGPALAKAAAFANTIGVKFTDIAEAGKNMVLNYKDSIKAEMSLSAMLGRRVDLSQVRALFAAGRTEDALGALKAQGLNPANMNMFQQAQLQQALGGMDLNSLQKIATRNGRQVGPLGEESVGKGNKKFVETKVAAESAAAIGSAVASAMADLAKAEKLQGEQEKNRQIAIAGNVDGIKKDMLELIRLNKQKEIASSGIGYGLATGGAFALLTALLTRGKGIGGLFKAASAGAGGGGLNSMLTNTANTAAATEARMGRYIMSNKGNMLHEFLPSGKVNPNFTMAKNLGSNPIQQYNQGRYIMSNKGKVINEFLPSGKVNPNFDMAKNLGKNPILGGPSATAAESSVASNVLNATAKTATLGSKISQNLTSSIKGAGGALAVLTAALDYKNRKDAGQTTTQAAVGAAGTTTGGLVGAAVGQALIPIPVVGALIGGFVGSWIGGGVADEITGANEKTVEANEGTQEAMTTVEMTNKDIYDEINKGNLLDSNEYQVELTQKMIEILGLQTEYLNDIAESNRDFTSVNLDGSKVLNILNSRTNKAYGVTRLVAINRNVK